MAEVNSINFIGNIDSKEKSLLCEILRRFNFNVIEVQKIDNLYKVITNKGPLCLKKRKKEKHDTIYNSIMLEQLHDTGFFNVPEYIKTSDGTFLITKKGFLFYVTEWLEGEKCDLDDINEAVECVKILAYLHLAGNCVRSDVLKLKDNSKNWLATFKEDLNDLDKCKVLINRKKIKSEFDINFISNIDEYYNQGLNAINILSKSNFYNVSNNMISYRTVCNKSKFYKKIIKVSEKFFLMDADDMSLNFAIIDLVKFIRKLMHKDPYMWEFSKARRLIEAYSDINCLNKKLLEAMLGFIIFPHKFCKLGRKRYIKNKKWNETKYMEKFNKIIDTKILEQKFFNDYLIYLDHFD